MKIANYQIGDKATLGIINESIHQPDDRSILILENQPAWPNDIQTLNQLIARQNELLPLIKQILEQDNKDDYITTDKTRYQAPIPIPQRNVICLGWNYAEHAKESSAAKDIVIENLPDYPIVFTKATTTVNSPYGNVVYDETVSRRLDWEVELGVIIGKQGRDIAETDALEHVFGYTVINDISARDLQKRHQQFFLGKSMDGTCPMGPWVVTKDEIIDPQNLDLFCRVNGIEKQNGNTAHMIFSIASIISSLSKVMTLLPGDIIATGTPSGVGFARTPPEYLQPGDVVECEIQSIGKISNKIV